MDAREMSNEFDVLLNSFGDYPNLVLDEYEKSVLLTEAQEMIVKELYEGGFGKEGFEETEELRRELDSLVVTDYPEKAEEGKAISKNSYFFTLKPDVWFITYESADIDGAYCSGNPTIQVIPMKQDEWHRVKDNPFKKPNRRKAVRLDCGNNVVEIVSEYPVTKYLIRYLKKPKPIILSNLDGLTINNYGEITPCELNTVLHRPILERAVLLASRRVGSKE